jgi:hypothetical protein
MILDEWGLKFSATTYPMVGKREVAFSLFVVSEEKKFDAEGCAGNKRPGQGRRLCRERMDGNACSKLRRLCRAN